MQTGTVATHATLAFTRSPRHALALGALVVATLLAGCASNTQQAPITDLSGGSTATSPAAHGSYTVQPGDTLYKIASSNHMDVRELAQLNNLSDTNVLRVGQVLRLNSSGPTPAAPSGTGAATTTPLAITPIEPVQAVEPATAARASDATLLSWAWPAKGDIIQSFNTNTKGIDIAGSVGDPIYAAADGNVMYAGNGVRGLGNLILLGHSNGFVTAYAHNQALLVKTGQKVKKGDKIASLGQTDTTSPRLHFEVRRRGTPVNPLSYLPVR